MFMFFRSKHKKALATAAVLVLAAGLAYWLYTYIQSDNTTVETPPAGSITLTGTMTCLPHRDSSGPQTLECAYGFKDETGRYFALRDTDPSYANIAGVSFAMVAKLEGTFIPGNDEKYNSLGVIEVKSIKPTVNSFDECAAAGNPIMESYPRQCRTLDGRNFVEDIM